jgi:hypothetical protein
MRSALVWSAARGRRGPIAAAVVALLLSSCITLVQDDTFAIGTEGHRANLVIYVDPTHVLDQVRQGYGTTAARNLVLQQTPSSLRLPGAVLSLLCAANPALCVAGTYVPDLVLSWFRSDVRNRSDFGTNLASAASQQDCFAWTFVPSRNFTEKPIGNSGCRQN